MAVSEKIKQYCKEITEEVDESTQFNFVFNNKIIIGYVLDCNEFQISEGVNNNMIGKPEKCANLFFRLILMHAAQIKNLLKFTANETIERIAINMEMCKKYWEELPAPMSFKNKTVSKGGNA